MSEHRVQLWCVELVIPTNTASAGASDVRQRFPSSLRPRNRDSVAFIVRYHVILHASPAMTDAMMLGLRSWKKPYLEPLRRLKVSRSSRTTFLCKGRMTRAWFQLASDARDPSKDGVWKHGFSFMRASRFQKYNMATATKKVTQPQQYTAPITIMYSP